MRSRLEEKTQKAIKSIPSLKRTTVKYESETLNWIQPAKKRRYTPDFKIGRNKFIECKGIWDLEDRQKMLEVIKQHPKRTFYMCFYDARYTISKNSNTTYGQWCDKHGILWHDTRRGKDLKLPEEWFK